MNFRTLMLSTLCAVGLMASRCEDDNATVEFKWNVRGAAPQTGCGAANAGRVEVDFGSSSTNHYFTGATPCVDGGVSIAVQIKDLVRPTLRYTARLYSADTNQKMPLTVASSDITPLVNDETVDKNAEFRAVVFVDFFVDGIVPSDAGSPDSGTVDSGTPELRCDGGEPDAGGGDAGLLDGGLPDGGPCGMPFEPCCPGNTCIVGVQCNVFSNTCG